MATSLQYHGPKPVTPTDFKMAEEHLLANRDMNFKRMDLNSRKIKEHDAAAAQAKAVGNKPSFSYNKVHRGKHENDNVKITKENKRIQKSLNTLTKLKGGSMAFNTKKTGTYKGKSNAPGGGGRFKQMTDKGMSPGLAAFIGRKKFGAGRFAKMAAGGRKG